MHPFCTNQDYFDSKFCQQLADELHVSILTLDGLDPCGRDQYSWILSESMPKIGRALDQALEEYTKRPSNSQVSDIYLCGVANGGLVAICSAAFNSDKYAGAVALYPATQSSGSINYFTFKTSASSAKQFYSIEYEEDRPRIAGLLTKNINQAASTLNEVVDSDFQHEFTEDCKISPEVAQKMIKHLQWIFQAAK